MRRFLFAVAVLLLLLLPLRAAFADVGFFAGDNDWGSSDSGSSGWDNSDWGSSGWDSSSGYERDVGSDLFLLGGLFGAGTGERNPTYLIIAIVIVVILMAANLARHAKRRRSSGSASPFTPPHVGQNPPDLSPLFAKDPAFSPQRLLDMVGNEFLQLQRHWESKDWAPMRRFLTDALYNRLESQLNELIERHQTNHMEQIALIDSYIIGYSQQGEFDTLTVRLTARMIDYTVDDLSGKLVSGSKTKKRWLTYDWKLIRAHDAQTDAQAQGAQSRVCPHCGAPIDINRSGKCAYCGSVVTLRDHDWVLSGIDGVSQRTE